MEEIDKKDPELKEIKARVDLLKSLSADMRFRKPDCDIADIIDVEVEKYLTKTIDGAVENHHKYAEIVSIWLNDKQIETLNKVHKRMCNSLRELAEQLHVPEIPPPMA
jgi:transcription termination factor NusB